MDKDKKRVQISLTKKQFMILDKYASEKGLAKSAVVILALDKFLNSSE